ncbi:hypothetical protein SLEP1_g48887 [Rubroshorea leprosula]|uniref:DUF7950 domain-containing protein n=1 Tax=Rubroshorea leprosula TaxID=152421 RepID=A0AAV5LX63_9ROSI|nr:hypothetical protein SLEP1_g48887 [Rubroshorea leprosula]
MDVGEKWRMLRCRCAQDKTVINQLRFRPIAPKPVTGDSGSGGSLVDDKISLLSRPRSKRKYVRVRKNIGHTRRTTRTPSEQEKKIVTLQLLPEKTELSTPASDLNRPVGTNTSAVIAESIHQQPPVWLNCHNHLIYDTCAVQSPDRMAMVKRGVVESWVTVEIVTDSTCMEARALGCTDMDRMKNLEADTCPGFISDGLNRVQWVNTAYRRMLTATEGNDGRSPEIRVWLVLRERLPYLSAAFSCWVMIQYTWQKEKWSRTVPCDVWRMDSGGFAWRLDVEAALSLGR